jgi:hypothetical protein
MKYFGLAMSTLTLLLLAAAPGPDTQAKQLPGFPDITYTASVLEPLGADGKPLLKIVRSDYLEDPKLVVWLLELQTDIGFEEKKLIDMQWIGVGLSKGPLAFFFDPDRVAINSFELKVIGKLYEGKQGDRIRMILEAPQGFPGAKSMEVRRSSEQRL